MPLNWRSYGLGVWWVKMRVRLKLLSPQQAWQGLAWVQLRACVWFVSCLTRVRW